MTITDYIETRRKSVGFTQKDLAAKLDMTQQGVVAMNKRGDMLISRVVATFQHLGLDPKTEICRYLDTILSKKTMTTKTDYKVRALIDWIKNLDDQSIDLVFAEYIGEDEDEESPSSNTNDDTD